MFILFQGMHNIGEKFSYVSSCVSGSLLNQLPAKPISLKNKMLFTTDLVFIPFNVRKCHWVLAVIVKPRTIFGNNSGAFILYVDPRHPHLSEELSTHMLVTKTKFGKNCSMAQLWTCSWKLGQKKIHGQKHCFEILFW